MCGLCRNGTSLATRALPNTVRGKCIAKACSSQRHSNMSQLPWYTHSTARAGLVGGGSAAVTFHLANSTCKLPVQKAESENVRLKLA